MTASFSKRVALLAVFAVLFQAVLFGWHHHDPGSAASGTPLSLSAPASGDTHSPAADEDGCEICIVLHHQATAPLGLMATPVPGLVATPRGGRDRAFFVLADYRAFHSRAPPRA